jgi:hypothetical protein
LKLIVLLGSTKTHAPRPDDYAFPGHVALGIKTSNPKPFQAATLCGKPSGSSRTPTSYVNEVTPSCMRCQQLMTHWNRKPQA